MKKLALLMLLSISHSLFAQSDGIQFKENTPWADVLKEAKQSGKLIFVDIYTEWCGPCKEMDKHTFPKKEVGDVFNQQFINYKIDAEKGEGIDLAKQYFVSYFPTFLFVDGEGELIYRTGAFMDGGALIEQSKHALNERNDGQRLVDLQKRYTAEKGDKNFMYTYLRKATDLESSNYEMLEAYLALLSPQERAEKKNLQLIVDNGTYLSSVLQVGTALDLIKEHEQLFPELLANRPVPRENFDKFYERAVNTTTELAIARNDRSLLEMASSYLPSPTESFLNNRWISEIKFLKKNAKPDAYFNALKKYVEQHLLKIPSQTLFNCDAEAYTKKIKENSVDGHTFDNVEYLKTLEHIITNELAYYIVREAEDAVEIGIRKSDYKRILKWRNKVLSMTEFKADYFKKVLSRYNAMGALLHHKLGERDKALAIVSSMEAEYADNPSAMAMLADMRTKFEN